MSVIDPGAIAPIVPAIQAANAAPGAPTSVDAVSGGAPPAAPTGNPGVSPWYQPPMEQPTPVAAPPVAPPTIHSRRPSMASAAESADQATQGGYDTAAAQEAVAPAKTTEREANTAEQHKVAVQQATNAAEIERTQKAQSEGLKQARDIANQADEEYKNFKFHDYWSTRPSSEHLKAQIFSGLGEFAGILSGTGRNQAAQNINSLIQRDFDQQKAKLSSLENFAKMKSEGVNSLSAQFKNDIAVLGLKQAAATNAVAEEAKAQAIRNGEAPEQAENNALVKQIRQKALELRAKNEADLEKARAALAMAGMKAAPNQPADPNVLAAIAKLAQQPGVTQADVYAAAARSGIKNSNKELQPILDNVNSQANKASAAAEKEKERTINIGGETLLAPSVRQAMQIEQRAVNYQDAVESLEGLKAKLKRDPVTGRLPAGDEYDRAVLAVAATTTANPSDKTTMHEAGTLKNWQVVSDGAIDRTLKHIKERQEKFLGAYRAKGDGAVSGAAAPAKSESPIVKVRDKKTGEVHSVRMGDDGKYHTVDEDIKL